MYYIQITLCAQCKTLLSVIYSFRSVLMINKSNWLFSPYEEWFWSLLPFIFALNLKKVVFQIYHEKTIKLKEWRKIVCIDISIKLEHISKKIVGIIWGSKQRTSLFSDFSPRTGTQQTLDRFTCGRKNGIPTVWVWLDVPSRIEYHLVSI